MSKQVSYSKMEKEVRPMLRESINRAESTEDVKKFFVYAAKELLDNILEGRASLGHEDISLAPDKTEGFTLSQTLMRNSHFKEAFRDSDLPHILRRMAEFALKRYQHLAKHPDKTESKMYPIPG